MVTELEAFATSPPADLQLQDYVRHMLWPLNGWVREVCISVKEKGDDSPGLPNDMRQDVECYSAFWGATVVNEENFNNLRKVERCAPNGKLSGRAIWHASLVNPVLVESDVKLLAPSQQDQNDASLLNHAEVLDSSAFDARSKGGFSLGEEHFLRLKADGPAVPTPSTERYMLRPLALRSMLEHRGRCLTMKAQWYSLLATPGTILLDRPQCGGAVGAWVSDTTEFGAITWKCNLVGAAQVIERLFP